MIEVRHLTITRGGMTALDDVTLSFNEGEIICVIGPSASGKSALLAALCGTVLRRKGTILVRGDSLPRSGRRRASLVTCCASARPENPSETVYHFLLLGRELHRRPLRPFSDYDRQVAEDLLALFDLQPYRDEAIGSLSGGILKRAVLAHAFAKESYCLVLDEPTANLDLRGERALRRALKRHVVDGNRIALIASSDLTFAAGTADRLVVMERGRVVAYCPADSLDAEMIQRVFGVKVIISRNIYNGRPEIHLFPDG